MMNNETEAQADDEVSPWAQPRFLASAVVVAVIVVLGVVLALSGGKADNPAASSDGGTPPATATRAAGDCGLPAAASDAEVPTSAPTDTRWELVGKMIAPTAPKTHGPGTVEDGFRTCFVRSPMGALYAAVNFWATLTAKTDGETYRRLAAPSPARDKAIRAARGQTAPQLDGLQVAGFTFTSYDSKRAAVKLAFRLENGGLVAADTVLLWTDRDDWRYEIPLDQGRGSVGQISGLGGFIQWKGA